MNGEQEARFPLVGVLTWGAGQGAVAQRGLPAGNADALRNQRPGRVLQQRLGATEMG